VADGLFINGITSIYGAETYLNRMITQIPDNHAGWVLLGDIYLVHGELEKAQNAYQAGLAKGAESCPQCGPEVHGGMAEIARLKKDYPPLCRK